MANRSFHSFYDLYITDSLHSTQAHTSTATEVNPGTSTSPLSNLLLAITHLSTVAKNYGELYNILGWGEPYFTVNSKGHLCAKPHGRDTTPGQEIDVHSVIEEVLAGTTNDNKKVQFPMILRFPDVLKVHLNSLHAAFKDAIATTGYRNRYQGVYPIKVNQNKDVIQDLVRFGHDESYGLEAGSKPELLVAMGCLAKAKPGAYLVCNGYKDADFIALALSARAVGLNCIIVLEMEEELDIVVEQSAKLGVEPAIGIRAKLLTKIPGHFGSTAGKRGKFGLLEEKIYGVAERLREMGKLHWLTMLHFHIGSMIPTTEIVRKAVGEAAGIYCNLVSRYGAPMTVLDCGSGLGVDYDGTRSGDSDMSVAYGLEEYASSVVEAARLRCDLSGVVHPVLYTESGRAMVTHHSMIIVEALSANPEPPEDEACDQLMSKIRDLSSKQPRMAANGGARGLVLARRRAPEAGHRDVHAGQEDVQEGDQRRQHHLQLPREPLRVLAGGRLLGRRAALPDDAGEPAGRAADAQGHARRHHLRQRRQDRQVHWRRRHGAAAPAGPGARCLLRGRAPVGVVPGGAGMQAQPVQ
ncbi:hypothetical protein GQ55_6G116100 [Panicum hallii var. hallii]|uniref:Arginine decarboxylase n=1 Tax=Panicum hallii var. hallii TaxID=1504633 RepID=A0A2T7D5R6_9POAL|nr:hypothetical protein GQ55_6G116100 [Panicum hallii var. hallii]PUZ50932.1 hypothetical protein GQ55_6G116100 [Panicum hallii var. hallii]